MDSVEGLRPWPVLGWRVSLIHERRFLRVAREPLSYERTGWNDPVAAAPGVIERGHRQGFGDALPSRALGNVGVLNVQQSAPGASIGQLGFLITHANEEPVFLLVVLHLHRCTSDVGD